MKDIRKTIKKVLNEENKFIQSMNRYVDKYGIHETSEMFGLSLTEIVKITNRPINSFLAYLLINENFINKKLQRKYKEFKLNIEFGSTISWFCQLDNGHFGKDKVEQFFIYATPFWDSSEHTPIEISGYDLLDKNDGSVISIHGDGNYYYELKDKTHFESLEELFDWYDNFYLPETYQVLKDYFIPMIRSKMEILLNK
jgi:hypothetical protein